ncbi:MAG: hypothetical protein KY443_05470 [Actinobacteria bacterium]|nr:hypothetical protein [Actinomycetota bacterium]
MTQGAVPTDADVRVVRLLGMPTARFIALHMHVDDLLRELEIIALGASSGAAEVPREVRDVTRELLGRYAETRQSAWEQAEAAQRRGGETVDLELVLPVDAVEGVQELVELFDRADALSREGVLLTLPASPELVELRRWTADEITRQVQLGAAPTPFPGT